MTMETSMPSRNGYGGLASALVATTVAALVPALVAENFRDAFAAFGTDVPAITAFFLHHHWWLLVIPVAILGLWVLLEGNPHRGRFVGVIGALCAFATIATAVTAMYLPIWKLAAAI